MRQIDEQMRYWWRRVDRPATLHADMASRRETFANLAAVRPHRHFRPPRRSRIAGRLALVAVLGGAIFLLLTDAGRQVRVTDRVSSVSGNVATAVESAIGTSGYRVDEVSIVGHRMTAEADIIDALKLTAGATLLDFDVSPTRRRIEALPWVDTASIERVLPNRLTVAITERRAIAVWRRPTDGRYSLVDATGRELADVPARNDLRLPLLSGAGAPSAAAALLGSLTRHPDLLSRLEVAERVGDRRWTLRLAGLPAVLLPESGEAFALDELAGLLLRPEIKAVATIDLRVRGRAGLVPAQRRS